MVRIRGFLLKHRVAAILRRVSLRHRGGSDPPEVCRVKRSTSSLINWTHRLGSRLAKTVLPNKLGSARGYNRVCEKPVPVPRGHLAVYVGQKDGDFQRILVPVVHFNHPLFGDLLRESEKEYGFHHPGGITIPCRVSEFEQIQTRIKTGHCTRKRSGKVL